MSISASIASPGFDQFGLDETLVRDIRVAGFENPWPIQLQTIPAGLDGRDVLGLAQTRSRQDGGLRATAARPAPRGAP